MVPLNTQLQSLNYYVVGNASSSTIVEGRIQGLLTELHRQYYPAFLTACSSATTSIASVQWNALAASAVQSMLPSFTGDTSLVNFILELKDFRDVVKYLATGFRKKLQRLDSFRVKSKDGTEHVITITQRDKPLAWLSKKYLAYNFGWAPLYRDVVSLYESITSFEARYREMVRRENVAQQRYWGTWIPGTATPFKTTYSNMLAGPSGGWIGPADIRSQIRVEQEECAGVRYHATMRYRYKLPSELFEVGGKLKAYKDLLGINGNPAIIWNAIPFTFVIDWFFNVSAYLERLKMDNIQIQTEILDFCHSARIERRVNFSIASEIKYVTQPGGTVTRLPQAPRVYDSCKKVVYKRLTGMPDFRTAILSSGLNLKEFALSSALLGVRRTY